MSKIVQSPVKRWPGTVTLSDPLTFSQFDAWSSAIESALDYAKTEDAKQTGYDKNLISGLCACIESHDLHGLPQFTSQNFPATPRRASSELIAWLVREINALVTEADTIPND